MHRRSAFTLIELLTVVAIIGILAAILFPVAARVRATGQTTRCLSNLRQFGAAIHLYAGENQGRLPSSSHQRAPDGSSLSWTHTLTAYLGPDFIGRCPSVPDHPAKISYALNDLLTLADGTGVAFTKVRQPAATLLVGELAVDASSEHFHFAGASRGRVTSALFQSSVNVRCHGTGANYLFVDGHVATLPWSEIPPRLALANPVFLHP
ncbi:MAG: prepilin-type N-terminal cleavage/methylation domain-containing protein [Opitutaceae bacterium]|jgi:general secretion pathway protein G|nr:prepilin-type N-terminal cleavage/methylation domain-containing protein [Opitutaceae bacterium]